MKYKLQDWAGNVLDFRGYFRISDLAVPMQFESFDDGWDWILENGDENTLEDYYVIEVKE